MYQDDIPVAQLPTSFTESQNPQNMYIGGGETLYVHGCYLLNEAAVIQIERVADMLAALATFSHGNDKREEQLFNTLHFAAELLAESLATAK